MNDLLEVTITITVLLILFSFGGGDVIWLITKITTLFATLINVLFQM